MGLAYIDLICCVHSTGSQCVIGTLLFVVVQLGL